MTQNTDSFSTTNACYNLICVSLSIEQMKYKSI